LLSEQLDDKVAFAFLDEVNKEILSHYSSEELMNMNSSQLNKGKEILIKQMRFYNSSPITTGKGEVIDNLNLAKNAVLENIENLLYRNNKIDMIIEKSNSLNDTSYIMSNVAKKIQIKESERKNRYVVIIITLVVLALIVLYMFAF
jgi:vesicle-associated membrane protein 7